MTSLRSDCAGSRADQAPPPGMTAAEAFADIERQMPHMAEIFRRQSGRGGSVLPRMYQPGEATVMTKPTPRSGAAVRRNRSLRPADGLGGYASNDLPVSQEHADAALLAAISPATPDRGRGAQSACPRRRRLPQSSASSPEDGIQAAILVGWPTRDFVADLVQETERTYWRDVQTALRAQPLRAKQLRGD